MRDRFGYLSAGMGVCVIAVVVLLTLMALTFILTGQVGVLERARSLNLAYGVGALCAEAFAFAGVASGVIALLKKEPPRLASLSGIILNFLGACLFFPASASLLFNLFIGIAERLGK